MAKEAARKKGLGRGLAALMGDFDSEGEALERARTQRRIPIGHIKAGAANPRRSFDEEALEDLTRSIKEKGIVQPVIVRPFPGEVGIFEIIAGERRWRAAQKAGLHEIPVVINEVSDREALEIAIIENVQRADLNPVEEALGYQRLMDEFGYTQQELADVIGKSRSHVANTLRLQKLPQSVLDHLREGRLTAGHARTLITADDPEALANRILDGELNVREAERLAQAPSIADVARGVKNAEKDPDVVELERALSDALGLKVVIAHKASGKGTVKISYKSLDDFDRIQKRILAQ